MPAFPNLPRFLALLMLLGGARLEGEILGPRPPASPEVRVEPRVGKPAPEVARLGSSERLGTVAAGQAVRYAIVVPAAWRATIGVSSRSGEARISLYQGSTDKPLMGTERETGCIRWTGRPEVQVPLEIEVHTSGGETPFRLELLFEEVGPEEVDGSG